MREMLHCNVWSGPKEGQTIDAQIALAKMFLAKNIGVIIDDTNLTDSAVDRWTNVVKETDSKFEKIVIGTSWEECLKRDQARDKKVGRDVIMKMAMQFEMYKPDKGYIICDIDGTLAEISHRLHYVKGVEKKDWKGFFSEIHNDKPRLDVARQVLDLIANKGYNVVLVSGRSENHREATEEWFRRELDSIYGFRVALIMRGANDMRDDDIVKKDILDKYFPDKSLVKVVVDDRRRVLNMWERELPHANIINVGGENNDF